MIIIFQQDDISNFNVIWIFYFKFDLKNKTLNIYTVKLITFIKMTKTNKNTKKIIIIMKIKKIT